MILTTRYITNPERNVAVTFVDILQNNEKLFYTI